MPHRGSEEAFKLTCGEDELCTFKHYDTLLGDDTLAEVVCVASMVDTGAGVNVVKTSEGVLRMFLVCSVMSGYIFASSSAE